jgi:hypothetical protein
VFHWPVFSIKVFASLSVRINAIIPPRATELRFLTSHVPVEVTMRHHRRKHVSGDQGEAALPANESTATVTTNEDVIAFYRDIMSCMQGLSLSLFLCDSLTLSLALSHCLSLRIPIDGFHKRAQIVQF